MCDGIYCGGHLDTLGHEALQGAEGLALALGEPRGVLPLLARGSLGSSEDQIKIMLR